MDQKRLTESPEKTQQRVASHETRQTSATWQGGLHPILQLQRMVGNRNVAKLIQAKQLTPAGKLSSVQRN